MAKELSAEMQKVYDYVCNQQDTQDKIIEQSKLDIIRHGAAIGSASYYSVKNFIEVNFKENNNE